eukprot:s931_g5.t1
MDIWSTWEWGDLWPMADMAGFDYSTYRNAKLYMFAPSPNATPLQGSFGTPSTSNAMPEDADTPDHNSIYSNLPHEVVGRHRRWQGIFQGLGLARHGIMCKDMWTAAYLCLECLN